MVGNLRWWSACLQCRARARLPWPVKHVGNRDAIARPWEGRLPWQRLPSRLHWRAALFSGRSLPFCFAQDVPHARIDAALPSTRRHGTAHVATLAQHGAGAAGRRDRRRSAGGDALQRSRLRGDDGHAVRPGGFRPGFLAQRRIDRAPRPAAVRRGAATTGRHRAEDDRVRRRPWRRAGPRQWPPAAWSRRLWIVRRASAGRRAASAAAGKRPPHLPNGCAAAGTGRAGRAAADECCQWFDPCSGLG